MGIAANFRRTWPPPDPVQTTLPDVKNSSRRVIITAVAVLLCLILVGAVWFASRGKSPAPTPSATSSSTPSAVVGKASTGTPAPELAGCAKPGTEIIPTKVTIESRGVSEPVLSVGNEPDGAVGAPPKDQRDSMAWWNLGPKVGSAKGNVITTVHTWYGGIALGNRLADTETGLKPGDIIKLTDGSTTVCYKYREQKKISVEGYDPNSNVWIDPEHSPQLTIMICWDFISEDNWASRIIFYADQVSA